MVDKIRLHATGKLPADYVENLGEGFDARCVKFLHVSYADLVDRVLTEGGSDEELLHWCFVRGRTPTDEEIQIWNEFMRKFAWNDQATPRLLWRLEQAGFKDRTDIQTMFAFIDLDEGRDPRDNPDPRPSA